MLGDDPQPQPKLFTKGKFAIMLSAIVIGVSIGLFREYHEQGSISGTRIGASIVALVIGVAIVCAIGYYANKREKED